jgi:hypothetical protein
MITEKTITILGRIKVRVLVEIFKHRMGPGKRMQPYVNRWQIVGIFGRDLRPNESTRWLTRKLGEIENIEDVLLAA